MGIAVRVLVIEDSEGDALIVVSIAGNGKEALALLDKERFDLVLMDIQMPEMDGFEATAAIRQKEASTGKRLPIIAMTAHALKGDENRCLEAGMDAYVSKPIRTHELYATIQAFVTKGSFGDREQKSAGDASVLAPNPARIRCKSSEERLLDERTLMTIDRPAPSSRCLLVEDAAAGDGRCATCGQ